MIETVIFDMDDTLYDEVDYCKSGFHAVADFVAQRSGSAAEIFESLSDEFSRGNHRTTFNAALDKVGIAHDEKYIIELIAVYREHMPNISLPPDSESVLEQLVDKYTLALLTDGFLPAQRLKVEALGIEKYFKCIIYTEELGREFWKPSPVGFEKLLQNLDANAENAVYVADNEKKDFIGPNKLGLATIQIIRAGRIHTDTCDEANAAARHRIAEITELPALLEEL